MKVIKKLKELLELKEKSKIPKNWEEKINLAIKKLVEKRKKLQNIVQNSSEKLKRKEAWKELQEVDRKIEEIEKYILALVGKSNPVKENKK